MSPRAFAPRHTARGFTLIELLITVVVLAVIMAIAFPSFMGSIRKGRRAEAMASLSAIQQAQERYRSNNAAYASALATLNITTPSGPGGYYALSVDSSSATGYVVTANGSGGSQADDGECAKLSVQVAGAAISYASCKSCSTFTYAASDRCWSR